VFTTSATDTATRTYEADHSSPTRPPRTACVDISALHRCPGRRRARGSGREGFTRSGDAGHYLGLLLSVSLPDDDVEFLVEYADAKGMASRSAAVHRAVLDEALRLHLAL